MRIFPHLGRGNKDGDGYFFERGSEDGDGLNFRPVPIPIRARGFISFPISVPIPIGDGDFSPMWGGALMGAEIPRPIAIPMFGSTKFGSIWVSNWIVFDSW